MRYETMQVNYKNQKRYKTAKYPSRQPLFFVWLIWILSKIMFSTRLGKLMVEELHQTGVLLWIE